MIASAIVPYLIVWPIVHNKNFENPMKLTIQKFSDFLYHLKKTLEAKLKTVYMQKIVTKEGVFVKLSNLAY